MRLVCTSGGFDVKAHFFGTIHGSEDSRLGNQLLACLELRGYRPSLALRG